MVISDVVDMVLFVLCRRQSLMLQHPLFVD